MSSDPFVRACALADFPDNNLCAVALDGWRVLIARVGDGFHALNDRCTHAGSPLSTGRLRHGMIMCPLHGARFDLASGRCVGGLYQPVRSFPVRLADGWVEVAIPAGPPGIDERPMTPA